MWNYHICGLGLIGLCIWWDGTNQPSTVTVTAVITKSCLINTANNVNFGSMALVGQFNPINQSITLTCTKSQSYSSYFTNGNNPITGWRRMLSGTSNFLQYQITCPTPAPCGAAPTRKAAPAPVWRKASLYRRHQSGADRSAGRYLSG